jgi:hypothetical protein
MLRPTDVGYLNQLGRGNLSLGLRRLIDAARIQLPPPSSAPAAIHLSTDSLASWLALSPQATSVVVPAHDQGTRQYG